MSIEHVSKFITDLAMHFSPPRFDQEHERQAWQRSIMMELHGASPEVLERAARIIIQTRKNRYFPLIAECRHAVSEAANEVRFDQNVETLPELRKSFGDEWSSERLRLAYDLIKSGMGKEAARSSPPWILALWDFCRRFQRLPDGRRYEGRTEKEREDYAGCSEIDFCKKSALDFDWAYDKCLRGEAGPQSYEFERLSASMLAKREKLRAEVLGR
jgi:hypothetical protein